MLARALPLGLVFAFASSACVVHVNKGSGDAKPEGSADAGAEQGGEGGEGGDPGPIAEPDKPARAAPDADLADCPAEAGEDSYCTESGKLAGQWVMVDTLKVPAEAETLFEAKPEDVREQPSLRISALGDTLYVQHVSCGSCARVMGQGFSGQPKHMSEEQLRAMQTKLGLAAELPLLESIEAWTAFAGDERGSGALTDLAKPAPKTGR